MGQKEENFSYCWSKGKVYISEHHSNKVNIQVLLHWFYQF